MDNNNFKPDFESSLKELDDKLYALVNSEEIRTKEQAIDLKKVIAYHLGILNSKHRLKSNSRNCIDKHSSYK